MEDPITISITPNRSSENATFQPGVRTRFQGSVVAVKRSANRMRLLYVLLSFLIAGCASNRQPGQISVTIAPADFVVSVGPDLFVLRLVTAEQIALARARVSGSQQQGIISGHIAGGDGGFNCGSECSRKWTWHYVPETITFPVFGPELCNGSPSAVEANRKYWLETIGMLCPRSARIIEEINAARPGKGAEPTVVKINR